MKKAIAYLLALVVLCLPLTVSTVGASAAPFGTWEEKVAALADPHGRLMSCAHRGFWANSKAYPENSIPAILEAGAIGVDIVEVDVQPTSDGQYVLCHDNTLTRTTNVTAAWNNGTLTGTQTVKVAELSLAQLKKLKLKEGAGGNEAALTTYGMPTVTEALAAAKQAGVILLLDHGMTYLAGLCKVIDDADAWDYIMFQGSNTSWKSQLDTAVASYNADTPYYGMFLNGSTVQEQAQSYFSNASKVPPTWVYLNPSTLGSASSAEAYAACVTADMIAAVNGKTRIFLNTLVSSPSGADAVNTWKTLYGAGINIIQTDNPAALVEYIRSTLIEGYRYGFEGSSPDLRYGCGSDATSPAAATGGTPRLSATPVSVADMGLTGKGLIGTALSLTVNDSTFAAGHSTGWIRTVYTNGAGWDTDWSNTQRVQFYVDASAANAPMRLHFALMGTKAGTTTEGVWREIAVGATAWTQAESSDVWTAQTVAEDAYIVLPRGFKGWVRFSLLDKDVTSVWSNDGNSLQASLWRVTSLCLSVSGNADGNTPSAAVTGKAVYVDSFSVLPATTKGDVNDDGRVTTADVRMMLRSTVNKVTLTDRQTEAADLDGNGTVTVAEVRRLLRVVVGKETL